MRTIILISLIGVFYSCISSQSILTPEQLKAIPTGSKKIIVETSYEKEELFSMVSQGMARDGWPVKTNKDVWQITTDLRQVQESTTVSAIIFFEEDSEGTIMTITGAWGVDAAFGAGLSAAFGGASISGQSEAKMDGMRNSRPSIAFQNLALIGLKVPNATVLYRKD